MKCSHNNIVKGSISGKNTKLDLVIYLKQYFDNLIPFELIEIDIFPETFFWGGWKEAIREGLTFLLLI